MKYEYLPKIQNTSHLRQLNDDQLQVLAQEIREALCEIVEDRPAHFASNLGVVELCIALHLVFDLERDRIIWDTGHQIYPHKLVTGRFEQFKSIRTRGGLMGYPNPEESPFDLFMTGHAGASVSTALGLQTADDLLFDDGRKSIAVIGDGALPSGVVFEAINNAAELNKDMLVILNDNKMGICPRVGGLAKYLDKARVAPFYNGLKRDISWVLNKIPVVGESVEQTLANVKDGVKLLLHGGRLFEEMGFRYVGPVDGHDLVSLRKTIGMLKDVKGPTLLHVFTEKGHGFKPAQEDPVRFHTPAPFERVDECNVVPRKKGSAPAYTNVISDQIHQLMKQDERICVLTAAMCEGNKLGQIRADFPDRFFDTGICEGHAVAFAGGMAKSGMRPIVDIYSTFLQRSYDHIFQEVCLQNLPVLFCLDRAGLVGADGPTHHGAFDNTYMRSFPNLTLMAPGDAQDAELMLQFATQHDGPTSIRYPKTTAVSIERDVQPVELGKSETIKFGRDGNYLVFGAQLEEAIQASTQLAEQGMDVGVINARFLRPLDEEMIARAVRESGFLITVEESTLNGGFGSAVIEFICDKGLELSAVKRLGIPDRFIQHAERSEQLAEIGLDVEGLVNAAVEMHQRYGHQSDSKPATSSKVIHKSHR